MTPPILLAGALASADLTGSIAVLKAEVIAGGPELRVRDLVDTHGSRLPEEIASRIVVRLPHSADLSATTVAALIRRRVPALPVEAPAKASIVRITVRAAPPMRRPTNCFETVRPIAAGAVLTRPDVTPASCRSDVAGAALSYDRNGGALSSVRSLPTASYLGQLPQLPTQHIAKGASLTLRSTAGPVVVERSVTALQSVGASSRIFVRDGSGRIFPAPLAIDSGGGGR